MDNYPIKLVAFALSMAIHLVLTNFAHPNNIENYLHHLTIGFYPVDVIAMLLSVATGTLPTRFDRWRDFAEDAVYLIIVTQNALNATTKLQLLMGYNLAMSLINWFLSRRINLIVRIQNIFASHGMVQSMTCLALPCLVYLLTIVTGQKSESTSAVLISGYAYMSLCTEIMTVSREDKQQVFQQVGHILIVSSSLPVTNKLALISGTIIISSLLLRLELATEVEEIDWNEEDEIEEEMNSGDHLNNEEQLVNEAG